MDETRCEDCGRVIMTEELAEFIAADRSFDCGEFSDSSDYMLCNCNEEDW
jgi:hypothetical protein